MTVGEVFEILRDAIDKDIKIYDKPLCVFTTVDPDLPEEPIELENRYHIHSVDDNLDGHGIDLNI